MYSWTLGLARMAQRLLIRLHHLPFPHGRFVQEKSSPMTSSPTKEKGIARLLTLVDSKRFVQLTTPSALSPCFSLQSRLFSSATGLPSGCPALAAWTTIIPLYRSPFRPFSTNHGSHTPHLIPNNRSSRMTVRSDTIR